VVRARFDHVFETRIGCSGWNYKHWREVFYRRTAALRAGDEAFRALVSSNFSVRREHFVASGGFSADFSRWGGEDTELGWRLHRAGLFFVVDNKATIYHQTQDDAGPAPDWRREARSLNDGLIATKIPHRFYRRSTPGYIYETPKLSWIVLPTIPARVPLLLQDLQRQSFTDWEVVFHDPEGALASFRELLRADPRVEVVNSTEPCDVVRAARGEYLLVLHGWASVDHRLAGRVVRRLDSRPRTSLVTVGYQVEGRQGKARYTHPTDLAALERQWATELPIAAATRAREWNKVLPSSSDLAAAWRSVRALSRSSHMLEPLVAMPSHAPGEELPPGFTGFLTDRSALVADLRSASTPRGLASPLVRYLTARARRRPYRQLADGPDMPPSGQSQRDATRPGVRYVGWVGKDNLGDEAMLEAVRRLMPWADVSTSGDPTDLLLLGGGTLINRRIYLDWLREKDSPRSERAVFGTGVASPEFWGLTERPEDWVEFLTTCALVGIRGPRSAETLRSWGYDGRLEIIGDPALALDPPPDCPPRRADRLVISPVATGGELWGGSDEGVFSVLADLIGSATAEGRDVWLLSCFPGDDRHCIDLMRRAGRPDLPYLAGYADLEEALRLLRSAKVVVAERLHAGVLAAAMGTPFVGLEYRPKVRDFAASVGVEHLVLRTDTLTPASLRECVAGLEQGYADVAEAMDKHVTDLRQRLAGAADELRGAVT
jgi:hypothetical protein